MKRKLTLPAFLKGASLTGCMLLLFPVLALPLCMLCPDAGPGLCGAAQGVVLAAGWCGFGVSFWLNRKAWPGVAKNLTAIVFGVLTAALGGAAFSAAGLWPALLTAGFCLAACFWAERLYYRHYADLLGIGLLAGAAGAALLALIGLWVWTDAYGRLGGMVALCYLLALLIYALVRNQSNIDQLMERRRHRLEHLPKKIRYYNVLLLGVVCAVILLLFLFRKPLADGIVWAVRELLRLVLLLIGWIMTAIGRLLDVGAGDGSMDLGVPGMPEASGGEGVAFPVGIVLLLAAALLVFLLRRRILAGLKLLAERIAGLLKKSRVLRTTGVQSEYYEDRVENLPAEEREGPKREETAAAQLRQWKRLYRKYWKLSDPDARFAAGYELFLGWLRLRGVLLSPSDTTLDILQKGKEKFRELDGGEATEAYNLFLYREETPDAGRLARLDRLVRSLPGLR